MVQNVGRYEILEQIGRGGMAKVYLANDPRFERQVAIKILPSDLLHDAQFRTRFNREARTIASLEHPAIVPVYDFGEHEGQPYLVMRYLPGGSLEQRLSFGYLPVEEAARILRVIAPAIDEAHQKGIVHRDLKPGNILFDHRKLPYIADFGIAKLTKASASLTGESLIGTPAYMSPEQLEGSKSLDGRSDIYSLGIIFFEMLTGQIPFDGDSSAEIMKGHLLDPPPEVRRLQPKLPHGVQQIINKALDKAPDKRYQTASDLAKEAWSVANNTLLEKMSTQAAAVPPTMIEPAPVTVVESAPAAVPPAPPVAMVQPTPVAAANAPEDEDDKKILGFLNPRLLITCGVGVLILLILGIALAVLWPRLSNNIALVPSPTMLFPTSTATQEPAATPTPPPQTETPLIPTATSTPAPPTPTPTPTSTFTETPTPTPAYTLYTVFVAAENKWTVTEIFIDAGQTVDFIATGEWTHGFSIDPFGPDGRGTTGPNSIMPNERLGSLIGSIDSQRFVIGSSKTIVATSSGFLWMTMNDGNVEGNSGTLTVTIVVYP